jgi:glutamate formiminotransferase
VEVKISKFVAWILLLFPIVKVHALTFNVKIMVNIIPVMGENQVVKTGFYRAFEMIALETILRHLIAYECKILAVFPQICTGAQITIYC